MPGEHERETELQQQDEQIRKAVSKATEVLDKAISFDAETAESQVKYAEWVAALATAGVGITLSNVDKIIAASSLQSGSFLSPVRLISTVLVLFVAAIVFGAWMLRVAVIYRALFRVERTWVSAQAIALINHPRLVAAMTEANAILRGTSPEDLLYDDIVERSGGAVVELEAVPTPVRSNESYEARMVREESERLAVRLKAISQKIKSAAQSRTEHATRLERVGLAQQLLTFLGYALLVLAVALRKCV